MNGSFWGSSMSEDQIRATSRGSQGVFEMRGKPSGVVVFVFVCLFVIFAAGQLASAQQATENKTTVNPLVRVLQAKGVLTAEEVAQISQASSAADADQRLAKLLLSKGVISQADYDQTVAANATAAATTVAAAPAPAPGSAPKVTNASSKAATPAAIPAIYRLPASNGLGVADVPAPPAGPNAVGMPNASIDPNADANQQPAVIPALTPIRLLPVGALPREVGNIGFKLGSVRVTPYGFLKMTAIRDTSSPNGDDFPLPGFIASDTGPNNGAEFHLKGRSSRIGTTLEWLDPNKNVTITGKFEADFEGNFSRVDNRNLSSARSSMLGIRLAYARIDYKMSDTDSINLVFGQDWTPFGSSTLPNLLETTGLGIGFGNLYERAPQMRAGWTHNFGGFQLMPEVAMVFPMFGLTPGANFLSQQLGYGERDGADSYTPAVEARLVGQFQLDHAPGVAPAQIIISGEHQTRSAIALASAVPLLAASNPLGADFFKSAYPHGASVSSDSTAWDAEFQLPTRYFTLLGKYYNGSDLRFFFAGQILSNFTDLGGLTNIQPGVPSIDASSTLVFATNAACTTPSPACIATIAPQRPVRSSGGFLNLGLPLSRIFGADPQGRDMGWSLYFYSGMDFAKARDVERLGGGRHKGALNAATIYYKLNNWVTFSFEQSLYETYALPNAAGLFPQLVNGMQSRVWRDLRSEGGTIFTF